MVLLGRRRLVALLAEVQPTPRSRLLLLASVPGSQIGHGSAGYDRPRRAVGDGNWPAYRPAVAQGPAAAVSALVERVKKTVPTAVALRVDQDLVSVSDIAQRIGRTRESARLLVDAKRGPGNFPPPIGVVGDGIRVWPWSVVLEWSDKVLGVDLGENGVPPLTAAVLDVGFATRRSPELATALGRGWLTP